MSKEEFLKIQTCVLKVHIHCDGCKHKVKKILQKIDGVYKFNIDSEQGKVTVSGNVDPATLIKKLTKHGKHAEVWGAPKQNNNQQIVNQFKDMQIGGKGANQNNKGQKGGVGGGGGGGNLQQQGKGGGGGGGGINQLPPQLQQQMKGFQDLKLPQMKGLSMPLNSNGNKGGGQDQKSLKFKVPEEDEFDDDDDDDLEDDFDDDFDDDGDYSDEEDYSDDEFDDAPPSKMKPPGIGIGGGGSIGQMPNMANMANMMKNGGQVPNMPNMMKNGQLPNMMMNGQHPMLMKGGVGGGGGSGANGKNGGAGGGMPVQMNMGCGNSNGKKGGGGGNQNQVGDGGGQKGGKNGGGQPQEGKHGGGQNKNNGGGNIINGNGGKKGSPMNDEFQGMPKMMGGMNAGGGSGGGPVTNMSMGHMGQMGQMGNGPMGQVSAVQGLPAPMSGGGGGNPGGYFQGGGPQTMPGNPYYQQQLSTGMMNQPRAIAVGNDRFQPMMYARPPPETNYMPLYHPYGPYPPPPTRHDPYSNYFDDENTSSCSVM